MTTEKNSGEKDLLARRKLQDACRCGSEGKNGAARTSPTAIYMKCGLDRICTVRNFTAICSGDVRIPNWRIIWALRNIVNPAEWFFYEDETPGPEDMADISGALPPDPHESVNFQRLRRITSPHPGRGRNEISEWCRKNGLGYMTFYMVRSGQRPVSPGFILKVRSVFPPRLWFRAADPSGNNGTEE